MFNLLQLRRGCIVSQKDQSFHKGDVDGSLEAVLELGLWSISLYYIQATIFGFIKEIFMLELWIIMIYIYDKYPMTSGQPAAFFWNRLIHIFHKKWMKTELYSMRAVREVISVCSMYE